ncbi:redoxin domain-containing protein [Bacillus sp. DNRA2]|uniref:peroxiredoxin family protein n=1 Tax=Bacillus sp. DNRA2 TaxID=2723053 RepID=UPI00145C5172|nr:redoxin domain-containing protein [Bacillus sp. DNRA2]NMD68939.1 redoxin domain-containing protein [Bacillus sp. DNRA2]
MEYIQIGSITIALKWLILGGAILFGLILVKLMLNRTQTKEISKNVFELMTDSLFWGFIIWKLSLIIFEPSLVFKSLLSLLYFTGGTKGLVFAIMFALIYFFVKSTYRKVPQKLAVQTIIMFIFITIITNQITGFLLIDRKEQVNESQIEGVQIGNLAPDFQLESVTGNAVKLSDMRGKTVIVNFWATWCPPCKAEMPHIVEFYEEYRKDGVEILAVNLTTSEKNPKHINQFMEDYGISFPVLLDVNGVVADTYQAMTIPTSYVIDPSGKIVQKITGPVDKEKLKKLISNAD